MFKPTLLISEVFYWQTGRPGLYREVIDAVAAHDWYRGVETAVVDDPAERADLKARCERHGLTLLQWLTKALLDRGVSLAAVDEAERGAAVQCVRECVDMARDAGAFGVGLVSGADPGPDLRERAQDALRRSMTEVAGYLADRGMTLIIEALDRDQHKKQVLGPTAEAVDLIRDLRRVNPACGLCWDSAHVALMGEDFRDSLALAAGSALQMHLANAVLDPEEYFYGDHHFAPGSGLGFLTAQKAAETLRLAAETGAAGPDGIVRVGVEARTLPGNDPWQNERRTRALLQAALAGEATA